MSLFSLTPSLFQRPALKRCYLNGKRTFLFTAVSASILLATGCGQEPESDVVVAPVIKPALIEVITAQRGADLSFNGVVRAAERADLSFRTSGLLTDVNVKEGDQVKQGQLLAQLDDRDAKTALQSARLELDNSKVEYDRARAIYNKSKAIAKSDLDAITTRYNLAKNHVAEAERRLEYTRLYAPFDGIIGRKLSDNHVQIQANAPVFTLHNLDDLEVVIQIPHSVILNGQKEGNVEAELTAIPNQRFPLSLRTYATQADAVTQTYSVVLGFDDLKGYRVLPGMAVKVMPVANEADTDNLVTITVPLTALVPDNQGGQFVWVVDEQNKVQRRAIEIGALNQDRVEVKANLQRGEKVIIAGVSSVQEGMEVRPYTDEGRGE
ncbi:efflux RND transporter periplasmic adaptor subunit [Vibrio sp. SM6]|uniref:Efflux RND transporter periplasmic adaptor subunit n=1 Tax=Vibrio agarilyticus TaxID=2726741 RepID=A0A7X8YIA5_9VIBR|nr:efflux RND transporter periplasmic adaptor subunit [Vibrio agarilyticus]NLS14381.1 efflux RND transporter periplasmic adaptor subunit [Vibrio agarilyticus]